MGCPALPFAAAAPPQPFCQCWDKRCASYRPAGEPFDPSRYVVEPISEREAAAYVRAHHYSGTYPAARFRAGLFVKERFARDKLVGVGVFSVPMNQRVIPRYFPALQPNEGVELGRFILAEEVPGNGESWSLARMRRLLRGSLPAIKGIVAYSDPTEWRNGRGELVKRGHVGTIYKASNARYRGRSSARMLWLTPEGECLADRALSKVRRGETGERYVIERLAVGGAPGRRSGECGAAYIRRLQDEGWLRGLRHPGNHVFTWETP